MNHKTCMIMFVVFMIGLLPLFSSVSADDAVTVNIHLVGEKTRTRFGNPVIVAGIWHYINVTLEDQEFQELSLKFYKGGSMPTIGERNATNYYEWRYDKNSQQWTDINEYGGYIYIKNESCQKMGNTYSFCVGVKDTLPEITYYHENWTLEIYKDEDELYSENVVVEKPTVGLAKSHADIIKFNVDPFTEMDVKGDDNFIIENVGNIPLHTTIDYGTYNDIIEATNFTKTISPYTTSRHDVTVHSESWKPGIVEISGSVSGSVLSSHIITTAVITFEASLEINAPDLKISVGHSNYEIHEIQGTDIVFQYVKNLEMSEGEIRDITVYISGDGEATLDIWSDETNIAILKVSSKDQEGTPLTITSTNTSEHAVTVEVEALRENKIGFLYYELEVGGETQIFITQITVGPPSQEETPLNTTSIMTIIVILCIIFVIGYMVFSQMKHRRR